MELLLSLAKKGGSMAAVNPMKPPARATWRTLSLICSPQLPQRVGDELDAAAHERTLLPFMEIDARSILDIAIEPRAHVVREGLVLDGDVDFEILRARTLVQVVRADHGVTIID